MTPSQRMFLAAGLLFALCGAALIAAALLQRESRRRVEQRLMALLPDAGEEKNEPDDDVLQNAEVHGRLRRRFRAVVESAGGWRPVRLICIGSLVVASVASLAAARVFGMGLPASSVIGLALALLFFQRMISSAIGRRRMAFFDHLPAAIELIVRSAQAGIPVAEAIGVVGADLTGPVAAEFTEISYLLRLGVDMRTALLQSADRVGLLDFDCFVTALVVQRETGGQLSEALQNLATIIRRRKEMHAKAKGMTAEGRLTGTLLAGLPFALALMMSLSDPQYMKPLIADTLGRHLLLLSGGMILCGSLLIKYLTRSEL